MYFRFWMFSRNGANEPESKMTRMFRRVRQVAKSAIFDCILLFTVEGRKCNGPKTTATRNDWHVALKSAKNLIKTDTQVTTNQQSNGNEA